MSPHVIRRYYQGMRVLVIGGTKFIGPYVVSGLVAHGHDVTVYHRGQTEADLPKCVRHVHSPLAVMPVLAFPDGLLDLALDVVVHMVPMGEADARVAMQT